MDKKFKSGFVSMMGRTNVGKSSIMNALLTKKLQQLQINRKQQEMQ